MAGVLEKGYVTAVRGGNRWQNRPALKVNLEGSKYLGSILAASLHSRDCTDPPHHVSKLSKGFFAPSF
jgi:hypothetical protein